MKSKCTSGFCKSQHSMALGTLPDKCDVFSRVLKVSLKLCTSKVPYCFITQDCNRQGVWHFSNVRYPVNCGVFPQYSDNKYALPGSLDFSILPVRRCLLRLSLI